MSAVDTLAPILLRPLILFGRDCDYTPHAGIGVVVVLRAYVRGVRADDLFAAAEQGDLTAVLNAKEFELKLPGRTPRRYDRLQTLDQSYTVEEWRASPHFDNPVVYKVRIRGGHQ
jgi:hypothetical protein